jgi:tetratricopeptide (TPR) repeat protein
MTEGLSKDELIEQFKGNKILKYSTIGVGAVVLIVLIYAFYKNFIYEPNNERSKAEIARGIMLLEKDSTAMAIEELEGVVADYSGYDGGQLARYALGNLYLEEGRFEDALSELKKVKLDDTYLMTLTLGAMGDCYSEMGDYAQAYTMYIKAATRQDNDLTSPNFYYKAGINAEEAGDFEKAKECYEIIQDNYTTFASQKSIEKYVTRAGAKIVK